MNNLEPSNPGLPHPVDIHVGRRIALARKMKRMSQTMLRDWLVAADQPSSRYGDARARGKGSLADGRSD